MTFGNYASLDLTRGISAFGRYTYRCSASIERKGCLLIPSLVLELDAFWTLCIALTCFKLPRCPSLIIYADAEVHLVGLPSLLGTVYWTSRYISSPWYASEHSVEVYSPISTRNRVGRSNIFRDSELKAGKEVRICWRPRVNPSFSLGKLRCMPLAPAEKCEWCNSPYPISGRGQRAPISSCLTSNWLSCLF